MFDFPFPNHSTDFQTSKFPSIRIQQYCHLVCTYICRTTQTPYPQACRRLEMARILRKWRSGRSESNINITKEYHEPVEPENDTEGTTSPPQSSPVKRISTQQVHEEVDVATVNVARGSQNVRKRIFRIKSTSRRADKDQKSSGQPLSHTEVVKASDTSPVSKNDSPGDEVSGEDTQPLDRLVYGTISQYSFIVLTYPRVVLKRHCKKHPKPDTQQPASSPSHSKNERRRSQPRRSMVLSLPQATPARALMQSH